jgi:biopolymer transport protein ExbD
MATNATDNDDGMVSGINVTPLVDVTLVLLIIFMVTAKLVLSRAVPLDLPPVARSEEVQSPFGVELHANGDTLIDGKKVDTDLALFELARGAHAKNPEVRAVIHADTTVQHGRVIHALDLLKQADITRVAFGVSPIPERPISPPAE